MLTLVRMGTLETPIGPDIHIFTSTKQDWVKLSDDLPAVPEYYKKQDYWPAEHIERFNQVTGK